MSSDPPGAPRAASLPDAGSTSAVDETAAAHFGSEHAADDGAGTDAPEPAEDSAFVAPDRDDQSDASESTPLAIDVETADDTPGARPDDTSGDAGRDLHASGDAPGQGSVDPSTDVVAGPDAPGDSSDHRAAGPIADMEAATGRGWGNDEPADSEVATATGTRDTAGAPEAAGSSEPDHTGPSDDRSADAASATDTAPAGSGSSVSTDARRALREALEGRRSLDETAATSLTGSGETPLESTPTPGSAWRESSVAAAGTPGHDRGATPFGSAAEVPPPATAQDAADGDAALAAPAVSSGGSSTGLFDVEADDTGSSGDDDAASPAASSLDADDLWQSDPSSGTPSIDDRADAARWSDADDGEAARWSTSGSWDDDRTESVDDLSEVAASAPTFRGERSYRHSAFDELPDDESMRWDRTGDVEEAAPAGPPIAAPATRRPSDAPAHDGARRHRRARKVHRVVRHIEVWSVFKIALPLAMCTYAASLLSGFLLWRAAEAAGTIEGIEGFIAEAAAYESFLIDGSVVFRAAAVLGAGAAALAVAGAVIGTLLFNLVSDLSGGIRMTVIDEDLVVAAARPRRQRRG